MKMLSIVVLQSALQQQKSPSLEINQMIDQLRSEFQTNQSTQFLTPAEVAHLFRVDKQTVRNWTKKGLIKAYRYGHRVFYKRHELLQSLNFSNC